MEPYQLIYCDPPWQYSNKASRGAAVNHYPTMSLTELTRLPIQDIAADDAILVMWYTGNFALEAIKLAEAWGFDVRTMKGFTWVKLNQLAEKHITKTLRERQELGPLDYSDFIYLLNEQTRMNGGNYTRANTEDALIAVRGKGLERLDAAVKQVVYAPLGKHSEKPEEVRHKLSQLYGPVNRIELFARQSIGGWDTWGNESPCNSIELIPPKFKVTS
ncbi:MT-A70 family methyltransferase [Pectobacterium versatile]|uniref:MT-A70 family methyltransferase n=1 Tax=Pectobacterium versatile TaxID=2488639 RepID=UPI00102E8FFF|nr:MT-A70 family methyltransferase [Pectobacterium versatile]TAI99835.1 DNA methyltransferase [Pectobacterium versatile]UEQ10491.1 DNA methyltransferase [Pectobacterium versatile]